MTILEFDLGNTRIKWRAVHYASGEVLAEGAFNSLAELFASDMTLPTPDLVRLASVRSDDSVQQLRSWAARRWQVEVLSAQVEPQWGGVTNGYKDVSRMGVDRWLAMLAAYARAQSACVVVDAGTALTIDVIAADGVHQGGYIVPGLELMVASLQENTGIRLQQSDFGKTQPGRITEEAVCNGCLAAAAALIETALAELNTGGAGARLIIGGGDAELLMQVLVDRGINDMEHYPALVFDGLAIACPVQQQGDAQ